MPRACGPTEVGEMSEERRHEQAGESVSERTGRSDGQRVDEQGTERGDGRPSGVPGTTGGHVEGRPSVVREAAPTDVPPAEEVRTVAPEEEGETPETEHGPGADL